MKSTEIISIEKIDELSVHIHCKDGRVLCFNETELYIDNKKESIQSACLLFLDNKNKIAGDSATVAMWKLKAVLSSMGLLSQVDTALNSLPEPTKTTALLAWEYSPTVSSNSSVTKFVQGVLSLTDEQVEQIFTTAETLTI